MTQGGEARAGTWRVLHVGHDRRHSRRRPDGERVRLLLFHKANVALITAVYGGNYTRHLGGSNARHAWRGFHRECQHTRPVHQLAKGFALDIP
jgi:hypothetical protein